jgi:hypothetical protein
MAGYIPSYQKKNRIAAKRERELSHAIRHEFSPDKIENAAEALRQAKLSAYKAQWAARSHQPLQYYSADGAAVTHEHVAKWASASIKTIIDWYTPKTA